MVPLVGVGLEASVASSLASWVVKMLKGPLSHQMQLITHPLKEPTATEAGINEAEGHHGAQPADRSPPSRDPQLELDLRPIQ